MGTITVVNNVSLDGVMQGPARPDEDTRGGFMLGGWAVAGTDSVMATEMGKRMARADGALLLGRRTYEDFAKVWPGRTDNPYSKQLDSSQKYVASTTLKEPLPWVNSTLLPGDAAEAVAKLKAERTDNLTILGSGVLIESLMQRQLIDTFLLLIHPIVLGSGRHLFTERVPVAHLKLVDSVVTTAGVVIATYEAV
ncbi:MAG: dihydrofolate reductase [Actinobacteria bacterium]|nr:MAG: dihydrofolate reductase [Actinomycetota bacterium]